MPSLFRRKHDPPSGNTRIQVRQWLEQLEDSLNEALTTEFWEGESAMIESRIGKYRTALSIAETSLRNLHKVWADGKQAYRKMEKAIADMHEREKYAREIYEVMEVFEKSDKPMETFAPRLETLIAKNRKRRDLVGKRMQDAFLTFQALTGIQTKYSWIFRGYGRNSMPIIYSEDDERIEELNLKWMPDRISEALAEQLNQEVWNAWKNLQALDRMNIEHGNLSSDASETAERDERNNDAVLKTAMAGYVIGLEYADRAKKTATDDEFVSDTIENATPLLTSASTFIMVRGDQYIAPLAKSTINAKAADELRALLDGLCKRGLIGCFKIGFEHSLSDGKPRG